MYCAIGVEPTKLIAATSGLSSSASTLSLSPLTTLKTPAGRPTSLNSSAIQIAADGSFSLGFSTTVLPAAIASGKNHSGTIAGKLKGLMTPTTPTGCLIEYTSTPVDTDSLYSPFISCGSEVASSMTSMPRAISPSASEVTLPCSAVMMAASSFLRAFIASRKANMSCWRFARLVPAQPGRASFAAVTARSRSAFVASATSRATAPWAGL